MERKPMLKYRIKEFLDQLPRNQYPIITKKIFNRGIKRPTFYAWMNISNEDKRSIPADSLKIIASVLNCTMEELYNEVPVNG